VCVCVRVCTAQSCEERLLLTLENGPRVHPPSAMEVKAVESKSDVTLRIFFVDDSSKGLAVNSQTTALHVCAAVCRDLGLPLEGACAWGAGRARVCGAEAAVACRPANGHVIWNLYYLDRGVERPIDTRERILDVRTNFLDSMMEKVRCAQRHD
jgi:hypothetical protein